MSGNAQRQLRGFTGAFKSSALTATGTETVHDSTVAMPFSINGKLYSKSGTNADQATPTTDYNTGAAFTGLVGAASAGGQGCIFVWGYNVSGVVKVMQGPVHALDSAGAFYLPPGFPHVPDDICPFAYSVSKNYGQATTFTFGTSNWDASGHSHAIVNVMQLPDRPQTA